MREHHKMDKGIQEYNKMVNDNHQQGIARVKQRPGDLDIGQGGKMGVDGQRAEFKRDGGSLTPRKA